MADGDNFLYTGALLYCDKGCLILPFNALPKKHFLYGPNIGTTKDCVPILDIPSFGVCMVTRFPCIPMLPQWQKYHDGALQIEKFNPLLVTSECRCQLGGIIRIFDIHKAMDAAAAGVFPDQLAVVGDNLLKIIDREIGTAFILPPFGMLAKQTPVVGDVMEAFGRGIREGVVDTVVGLYELATTNPLDTLGGLATIVGVAAVGYGKYANPVSAFLPDPAGDSAEERLANFDKTFGTNLSDTHEGIKEAIAEKEKEFDEADPLKKAEMAAEMSGYGVVILADVIWGSKAAGRLSKLAKASKLGRAAQASRLGQQLSSALKKVSDLAGIVKQAAKAKADRLYNKLKDAIKGIFRVKKKRIARMANKEEALMIKKLKDKFKIKDDGKNLAKFEGEIDGKDIDLVSISGKKSPNETVKSIAFEDQQLKTKPTELDIQRGRTNKDVRAYDSEAKGLEEILKNTNPNSEGTIKIVSDRNMCSSCSDAIEEFEKLRPNIKVEKVYVREYP